nr:UvrD-helicase domain-containing protein [Paucibacter sp. M5-1]MCZ7880978.1 UvrD-helicase domain-containing protein [Paucibacter sp. M5-1]
MSLPKTARFVTQAFAPTEEQLRIQTSAQPTLLIEAAAGAAKTSTLALRIAESLALGTDPRAMLALTFTPTAVLALRQTLRLIGVAPEPLAALRIESCDAYATAVLKRLEGRDARRPVQSLSRPEQLKPHVWQAVADAAENPAERYPEELNPPPMAAMPMSASSCAASRASRAGSCWSCTRPTAATAPTTPPTSWAWTMACCACCAATRRCAGRPARTIPCSAARWTPATTWPGCCSIPTRRRCRWAISTSSSSTRCMTATRPCSRS